MAFINILYNLWPNGDEKIPGLRDGIAAGAPMVFAKYGITTPLPAVQVISFWLRPLPFGLHVQGGLAIRTAPPVRISRDQGALFVSAIPRRIPTSQLDHDQPTRRLRAAFHLRKPSMPTNAVMIAATALRHGVRAGHGHDPMDDRDAKFCERNGWFSRHGLAAAPIVFAASFFVIAGIDAAPADESTFPEKRCNSAGRHEAMPAGDGCFDLPPYARARPSCWKIRAAVHRYGEQFVAELARSNGASEADIAREKKRCLN